MDIDHRLLLLEGNVGQAAAIRRPDRRNDRLGRTQRRHGALPVGIGDLQGHLFLLYFAVLSAVTPPVAVAATPAASAEGEAKPAKAKRPSRPRKAKVAPETPES